MPLHKDKRSKWKSFLRFVAYSSLIAFSIGLAYAIHFVSQILADVPDIKQIELYSPEQVTQIYDRRGRLITEFFLKRRKYVKIDKIPKHVREAFIAIEDKTFYTNPGVDVQGILRAAVKNFMAGKVVEGGSTISQQLIKNLFLNPKRDIKRKIKEIYLAIKLNEIYSKDKILEMYLNQIYLGHGAYGVEAASKIYFDKHVWELNVCEAATIAGLPKAPSRYDPYKNPEMALKRKDLVIERMLEEKYIDSYIAETCLNADIVKLKDIKPKIRRCLAPLYKKKPPKDKELYNLCVKAIKKEVILPPEDYTRCERLLTDHYKLSKKKADECLRYEIVLRGEVKAKKSYEDYFTEAVKRWFIRNFGLEAFYKGGYKIYTTIDLDLQRKAQRLVQKHLDNLQLIVGFPKLSKGELKRLKKMYDEEAKIEELKKGKIYVAKINKVDYNNGIIYFQIHQFTGSVVFKGGIWKAKKDMYLYVQYLGNNSFKFVPFLESALISVNPRNGEVLVLIGGYSFEKSKYNRAIQTRRQPGSAFKPIVYATAIKKGYTQISIVYDEPVGYWDFASGRLWAPKNYDKKYRGKVILRYALAHSLNAAAVNVYHQVGKRNVVRLAKAFGIKTKLYPVPSLALGSISIRPIELASVYSTFANNGVRCEPHLVRRVIDYTGDIAYENNGNCMRVYPAPENAVMVDLLKAVIQEGTGKKALALGFPVAGKTGTTNNYSDAWFAGFSTRLATIVWVGYDTKRKIGNKMTGSRAALPLWINFMRISHPRRVKDFKLPKGAAYYIINMKKLVLATPACPYGNKRLVFVVGTQPKITCSDLYSGKAKAKTTSVEEFERQLEDFELKSEEQNKKVKTPVRPEEPIKKVKKISEEEQIEMDILKEPKTKEKPKPKPKEQPKKTERFDNKERNNNLNINTQKTTEQNTKREEKSIETTQPIQQQEKRESIEVKPAQPPQPSKPSGAGNGGQPEQQQQQQQQQQQNEIETPKSEENKVYEITIQ